MTRSRLLAFTSVLLACCVVTGALGNQDPHKTLEESKNIFDELDEWLNKNIENVEEADPQAIIDKVSEQLSLFKSYGLPDGLKKAMNILVKLHTKKSSKCNNRTLNSFRIVSANIGWIGSHNQSELETRETASPVDRVLKYCAREAAKNCEPFIENQVRNLFEFWGQDDGESIFNDRFRLLRPVVPFYSSDKLARYSIDLSQDNLECLIAVYHQRLRGRIIIYSDGVKTYNGDYMKRIFKELFVKPCKPLNDSMSNFFESVHAMQSLANESDGGTQFIEKRSAYFKQALTSYLNCKSVLKKTDIDIEEIVHRDTERFKYCFRELFIAHRPRNKQRGREVFGYQKKKQSGLKHIHPLVLLLGG